MKYYPIFYGIVYVIIIVILVVMTNVIISNHKKRKKEAAWIEETIKMQYFERGKYVGRNAMMKYSAQHFTVEDETLTIEILDLLSIEDSIAVDVLKRLKDMEPPKKHIIKFN